MKLGKMWFDENIPISNEIKEKLKIQTIQEHDKEKDQRIAELEKEVEKLKNDIHFNNELIKDLETIRVEKNNPLKPRFYYDENINNKYKYVFCARPYDDNMSLHCFTEQGHLYGYASEHYDTWNTETTKPIKEMDFNMWAYEFIAPLVKENAVLEKALELACYELKCPYQQLDNTKVHTLFNFFKDGEEINLIDYFKKQAEKELGDKE